MSRLAVVSGGATGIGLAVAKRLADDGDEVVIIGRRADRLAMAVEAIGDRAVRSVVADLSEPGDVRRAAAEIVGTGRQVDVLVNNAGGNADPSRVDDLDGMRDAWLANVRGNVLPAVLLTQALLPSIRRPKGRIVTVGSVAAVRGPATYGGAKAALHPWSAELAAKLAPDDVTVNVVAPGYVTGTEFYGDRMSPEFHAGRSRLSPMNRGGSPAEVAAVVCTLAAPDAGFITGQVVHVNGGALLART
ncbi:SDR family NAD(P)-dependent oxidoreductase [Saccharopolyspora sp. NPDC003752]